MPIDWLPTFVEERSEPVKKNLNNLLLLRERHGLSWLPIYVFTELIELGLYDRYVEWLERLLNSSHVLIDVRDYEMVIDVGDGGLSKQLFLYGTRENRPSDLFEEELSRVDREAGGGIVVDVGANIGYYTIMEANAVGSDSEVVAIEPDGSNVDLLETNLGVNGIRDRVSVHRGAVGAETGTATLQLAEQSNLHRIEHERVSNRGGGSESVPLWSLDDFLAERDRDPGDVIAVRMDIEGYELEALQGMSDVLEDAGPLLLYVEVHNNIFCDAEVREFTRRLSEAGFEIRAVERTAVTADPFEITLDAETWAELEEIDTAYSLIVEKPATEAGETIANPALEGSHGST